MLLLYLLVTFDVGSLCTNIWRLFNTFSDYALVMLIPVQTILELTNLVLPKNYFLFKDDFYLQRVGCAIGSKMAPQLANIYMGKIKNMFILNPVNPFHKHEVLQAVHR